MDKKAIISGGFWLCAAIAVLFASLRLGFGPYDNPGPGFLSFGAAFLLAGLSGALLWSGLRSKGKTARLIDLWQDRKGSIPLAAASALVLYGLVLPKLGYLAATFGLMVVLFSVGKIKLPLAVPGALLASLLTFVLFDWFLKMPLPRGIFGF
ncbi:MAG: tripartite tricarboxylate transporter TctB family protein [Syntrophales bacterium]|jgi:hypothetical protein|nr:tripartite tricarboxylate transporter TctB family protein [Syntrophales bacterium]